MKSLGILGRTNQDVRERDALSCGLFCLCLCLSRLPPSRNCTIKEKRKSLLRLDISEILPVLNF